MDAAGRKGERAVYRMHIEASFHGHRRPWSRSPGLDTRSVNGGNGRSIKRGEGMAPVGWIFVHIGGGDTKEINSQIFLIFLPVVNAEFVTDEGILIFNC